MSSSIRSAISYLSLALFVLSYSSPSLKAQSKTPLVYVDKGGILRYTKTKQEASFFGTNYTVPFAYGYRSVKRTGIEVEKAIDADVYHMARLGLDAFRVHVWDWEITDSVGNLLENDHLRLFDYLVSKLKERNIRIIITPIAFWGNGYPEKDEHTRSFSDVYGKGAAVVNEKAIQAQENYLKQFFRHINPYTKLTYKDDEDVIATELNNEPHHSGPKEKTTEYINRLANAVKTTGWNKPVFYNISESPSYADAVAKSTVDGCSFQWYPTSLVANHTQQGNFLPNVDRYYIPFIDTIPAFKNKARMVYEFDAGDVLQSNMYPAIARSFRTAGFQWATQFAYDPMATAYANTEYQTHYLNLAYTPSKAISLMIASKAFHTLPLTKSYGTYPTDSSFGVFRVSYKEQLSEMNSDNEFYYSNSTQTKPINQDLLTHVAGVGSSAVITYSGYGAYFVDKVEDGVWRLEVMPDALHIRDPFEKASPQKAVTTISWQAQTMKVNLSNLGSNFGIKAIDDNNSFSATTTGESFTIRPGTYLLTRKGKALNIANKRIGVIKLNEFVAPKSSTQDPSIVHAPFIEVSANKAFNIDAKITGVETTDKILVELRNSSGKWKTVTMTSDDKGKFVAEVPADMVTPGVLNYRIIIHKQGDNFYTYPGGYKGDPYAWDYFQNDTYQTYVATENSRLEIFNPSRDRSTINTYTTDWRNNSFEYITAEKPEQLILKATMNKPAEAKMLGFESFVGDKLKGRMSELESFSKLVMRARSANDQPLKTKVCFITNDGVCFAAYVTINKDYSEIQIPLNSLKQDSALLLPRPYPGFQPLWFKSATAVPFKLSAIDKLQITFQPDDQSNSKPASLEIESVWLQKQ